MRILKTVSSFVLSAFICLASLQADTVLSPSSVRVESLREQFGRELDPAFEFVRDDVRYDCYRGVLRGSRGTLISRAGNSLDQALLLRDLLLNTGYEVRFARGKLDATRSAELINATFPDPDHETAATEDASPKARKFFESLNREINAQYSLLIDSLDDCQSVSIRFARKRT